MKFVELVDWALSLEPSDLPEVPFQLNVCTKVTGKKIFLEALKRDIRKGIKGERARFGALQDDIRNLYKLIEDNNND